MRRIVFALFIPILLISGWLFAADATPIMNVEFLKQYAATHRFSLGKPGSIKFAGDRVLFLRSGPRSVVQDLYEFDPSTGQERVILTADQILAGKEEKLTAEELARRERTRSGARGIASFILSDDERTIFVPLSGRLFNIDRQTLKIDEIKPEGNNAFPIDPQLSRDASKLACVRDNNLFVIDLATNKQTQLTSDGGGSISNGLAEFVAQEEMGRFNGFWFSPDGSKIAYQRNDTSALEQFYIADPSNSAKAPQSWPYPRAGKANAIVTLGIVSTNGGDTTWVKWDREKYPYLATVKWAKNAPLTILVQNRRQTEEVLLSVDDKTGDTSPLLTETDSAWLNLAQSCPKWLDDGSGFLWMTERGGAWQLELHDRSGKLIKTLTKAELGLRDVIDVDQSNGFVYVGASDDQTQSHVVRVLLKPGTPNVEALTSGAGHFGAVFSKDHSKFVLSSAKPTSGSAWEVRSIDGRTLGALKSVAEEPNLVPKFELARVGEKQFNAAIVRPRAFDPAKKYPVIVSVYGGPHGIVVSSARDSYLDEQWLADQGFIIVKIDGRGTPGRGREWERVTSKNFIDKPLEDQIDALSELGKSHPELDLSRVGITGWSFGGYFTCMATMRRPDVFKCGVAGAPVADFADYDTYYTERYLGLPSENSEGYQACNVLTWAKDLSVPLLLIHGTADDNVYFMHSLKICDALTRAGKSFEFLPLTGFTHAVRDPDIIISTHKRTIEFFKRNLGEPK